jgi:chorismate mutase
MSTAKPNGGIEPDTGGRAGPLRDRIDRIDRQLVVLLADRARLVEQCIALPADPAAERQERVLRAIARRRAWAAKAGLDQGFTEVLFAVLLARDVAVQSHRRELPQAPPRAGEPAQDLPSAHFQPQG